MGVDCGRMADTFAHRQNLNPLLCPRSVAVVGISQLPRFGGWVYQNLRNLGYPGAVYGVNPRYNTLFDQPCYPRLSDLPAVPECAVLAVPNDRLLAALEEAAGLGVKAAVISASAYSAPGAPSLQHQLAETARASGMVLCGPNGMGLIAFASRFAASGYPITPDLPSGNIAFVTHSGTVFDSLWQNTRGLRFNYLVSSGNEIVTTLADYAQFALEDPSTRAIGLFLETVRDPATFRAVLAEAAARDVPVVALKVGRTARGAQLAQTHSGAVAGDHAVYQALFKYYGVRSVQSLDEMLDTLELFAAGLRPPTRYITSIHDSGGQRGLLVDLAEAAGVAFAPINAATTAKLAAILEPGLAPTNPLDAWGTGNDIGRIYRESMLALDSDPSTGLNVWVADLYAAGMVSDTYSAEAIAHKACFTRPLVFLANIAAAVDPGQAQRLRAAGIPVLLGTENGLRALSHLLDYCADQRQRQAPSAPEAVLSAPPSPAQVSALRQQLAAAGGPLDEFASKALLRGYGLTTAPEAVVHSLSEALQAAGQLGYPVALKPAAGALHKSDQGGVLLDQRDAAALTRAYRTLADRFGPRVLVQKMVPAGTELILGLIVDPQFGPLLTLGLGGLFVEVFQDVRVLALPATAAEVREALLGLKSASLLRGTRGRPQVDLEAIVDAALRLARLAGDLVDLLAGVDINPLMALPEGTVVVDALIIPRAAPAAPADTDAYPQLSSHEATAEASAPQRWVPGAVVGAPLQLLDSTVLPAWIDYNGHMTESSYLAAFGEATDALFRYVGIDEAYRAEGHSFYTVETHINYYQEAVRSEPLHFTTHILGLDEKRLHLFHTVTRGPGGPLLATTEQMLLHVFTHAGGARTAPIQPEAYAALQAVLAAHQSLPRPEQAGRQIALK